MKITINRSVYWKPLPKNEALILEGNERVIDTLIYAEYDIIVIIEKTEVKN